jgi:hypothetical protein
MAGYLTSAPPVLLVPSFDNASPCMSIWTYSSTDNAATVDASGYITNGGALGMKVGDIVISYDNDATPPLASTHTVVTVSSTYPGAVDLSNGVTIGGGSNSD